MKAELRLIEDWGNKKYYLVTLIDNEEVIIEIEKHQFYRYKEFSEIKTEMMPF